MKKLLLPFNLFSFGLFVIALLNNVNCFGQRIAAGFDFTLVICKDSTVSAFGMNTYGQLGDGTTIAKGTPVKVIGLNGVIAVSAGYEHSMALKSDGTVWAWGKNHSGQLGDSLVTHRTIPGKVNNLNGIIKVAAGVDYSFALKSDGNVYAWGSNFYGQLGDGTVQYSFTPIKVLGINNCVAIVTMHGALFDPKGLAVKADGTLWQWGGGVANVVQVNNITNVKDVAQGEDHTLALKNDGTVWSWGLNIYGELGDGTSTSNYTPAQVMGIPPAVAIAVGHFQSYVIDINQTIWSWGENLGGQLADSTLNDRDSPYHITGLSCVTEIKSGMYHHAIALKDDGTFWAWGSNSIGQLGDGTINQRLWVGQTQVCPLLASVEVCNTGLDEIIKNEIAIYPNPASNKITISNYSLSGKEARVEIYNMMGEKVFQSGITNQKSEMDISSFAAGVYLVQVGDGEKSYRGKIIKQ